MIMKKVARTLFRFEICTLLDLYVIAFSSGIRELLINWRIEANSARHTTDPKPCCSTSRVQARVQAKIKNTHTRRLPLPRRRSPSAILDDNNWMSNHTTWLSCVTAFEESRALDRANGEDQSSRTTSQSSRRACFDGSETDLQSDGEDDAILLDFVVASSAWPQRSKNSDCEDGPNLLSRRDRYCFDGFQSLSGDDADILRCSGNTDEGIKRDVAWSHHSCGGVFRRTRSPFSDYRFINGEDIDR